MKYLTVSNVRIDKVWLWLILWIGIFPSAQASLHTNPRMIKQPVLLQAEDRYALEYNLALDLIQKNEIKKAENILLDILKNEYKYHPARIQLVHLYLNEKNEEQAKAVLQEGLNIEPHYPEFLKLSARIEEQNGNIEAALKILSAMPNQGKRDIEYAAWLGLLYQKAGYYTLAENQYTKLTEIEPNNAAWWLGLSLAFEAEGKKKEALLVYQKAYAVGALEPAVLEYISHKISTLSKKSSFF